MTVDLLDRELDAQDRPGAARSARRTTQRVARWLHVYTSMIALFIVLFFGVTGITLNHPDWTFGDATSRTANIGNPDGRANTR